MTVSYDHYHMVKERSPTPLCIEKKNYESLYEVFICIVKLIEIILLLNNSSDYVHVMHCQFL